MPSKAKIRLKCGVQHSTLAVVGEKSGPAKMPDADFCIMSASANRSEQPELRKPGASEKVV
jgi:hypothetical protein